MVIVGDLRDFSPDKRQRIQHILDVLLLSKRITGYNWYDAALQTESSITLSHMHEDIEYRAAVVSDIDDLLLFDHSVSEWIRSRGTAYFPHHPNFIISEGLRLKQAHSREYLNLKPNMVGKSLEELADFLNLDETLIGELDSGWEINIPFLNRRILVDLAALISQRAYLDGNNPWPMAHRIPVIVIGSEASRYLDVLKDYSPATKVRLRAVNCEMGFITGSNIVKLRDTTEYWALKSLGFEEEACFANDLFINGFVAKNEKY